MQPVTPTSSSMFYIRQGNKLMFQTQIIGQIFNYDNSGNLAEIHNFITTGNIQTKLYYDASGRVNYYKEFPINNGVTDWNNGIKYDPYGNRIQE